MTSFLRTPARARGCRQCSTAVRCTSFISTTRRFSFGICTRPWPITCTRVSGRQRGEHEQAPAVDRKSVVEGKSVSVRVDLGGRRVLKKKEITEESTRRKRNSSGRGE